MLDHNGLTASIPTQILNISRSRPPVQFMPLSTTNLGYMDYHPERGGGGNSEDRLPPSFTRCGSLDSQYRLFPCATILLSFSATIMSTALLINFELCASLVSPRFVPSSIFYNSTQMQHLEHKGKFFSWKNGLFAVSKVGTVDSRL